jgi:isopenicillin N synthase-like dioxygenase
MSTAGIRLPDVETVPLIDFAPFLRGDAAGKLAVAAKVRDACETIGFLYLRNHGVPESKITGTLAAARHFFGLPNGVRLDPDILTTPTRTRGYMTLGSRHYAGTGAPDLMEAFKVQQELPPDDPDIVAGGRGQEVNRWPVGEAAFRATVLDYFDEMTRLSHALLRAFALALELPEDHFLASFRKPQTQLSLLHYPPQAPAAPEDEYGIRPHADATAFTILYQDEVGGLQVQGANGGWIQAPPIPGTYVINIGDMMARWTNDRFASTKHRVFNRTGRERYSLPFFGIPDYDAVVACLSTCQSADNPAKYPPLSVGEFIKRKNSSDWTGRDARKGYTDLAVA